MRDEGREHWTKHPVMVTSGWEEQNCSKAATCSDIPVGGKQVNPHTLREGRHRRRSRAQRDPGGLIQATGGWMGRSSSEVKSHRMLALNEAIKAAGLSIMKEKRFLPLSLALKLCAIYLKANLCMHKKRKKRKKNYGGKNGGRGEGERERARPQVHNS